MPFNLGLVSHGASALGLPKGRIQYRADLAQNGAETGLDGLWDLGKGTPLPAYFETLIPNGGLKEDSKVTFSYTKEGPTFWSSFSTEILVQVPISASVGG